MVTHFPRTPDDFSSTYPGILYNACPENCCDINHMVTIIGTRSDYFI
jgi:hypothetical protein